jgi:hypothetical protein
MHYCHQCGGVIESGLEFCVHCGTKQIIAQASVQTCPNCHALIDGRLPFCTGCGVNLKDPSLRPSRMTVSVPVSAQGTVPVSVPVKPVEQNYKAGRKGKGFKTTAFIALVTLVCLLVFINREALLNLANGINPLKAKDAEEMKVWSFGGDLDPSQVGMNPEPPVSGTKAQTVSADLLTIRVADNALDSERELKLEKLSDEAMVALKSNPPEGNMAVFDAYTFSAGLKSDEKIPGTFDIRYNLSRTQIPEYLYDYVRVVRIGEDPMDTQILASVIEGTELKAESSKNSVIAFTLLGYVIVGAVSYETHKILSESFGNEPYLYYVDNDLKRFTFYWPQSIGYGNPDVLKSFWTEEINIYKAQGLIRSSYDPSADIEAAIKAVKAFEPIKMVFKNSDVLSLDEMNKKFAAAYNSAEYKALGAKCTTKWIKENVLPKQVQTAILSAQRADNYLYGVRKFAAPSSVDVYISKLESDLGSSFNPALFKPYMTVKVLPDAVVNDPTNPLNKKVLDNFLVTFTHELFHVTQSARYIRGYDFNSYTWFWEATATLVENEGADYYKTTKVIEDSFEVERHGYDEAYSRALGLTGYWGTLSGDKSALQNQGYMMGYLLIYLRDHYMASQGVAKNDYLLRLMNGFKGSIQKPIYTIIEQTTNSGERFEMEAKLYFISEAKRIASKVSTASKDTAGTFYTWVNAPDFVLTAAQPIVDVLVKKNPMASPVRQFALTLDSTLYGQKQDVTLVVKRGEDEMQNNQDLALQVLTQTYEPQEFTEKVMQGFANFGGQSYAYVQEIHLYPDGWLNDFSKPYQVFLMLKPKAPQVTLKDNLLTITLPPHGVLWDKGIVDKHLLTILDPLGNTLMMETDKPTVELTLGPSGGFTELDDPEMKKMVGEATRKYLNAHPELKAQLETQYGADTIDKAIQGTGNLNIDYGVLSRAAEVLNSALGGQAQKKEIIVSVKERTTETKLIYGPSSDETKHPVDMQPTAKVNINGSWVGKVQFSGQEVLIDISAGKYGFDYTIVNSMYAVDGVIFYGRENNDGTVSVYMAMLGQTDFSNPEPFTTLIKNSDKELYMAAPPMTLKRK